MKKFSLFVLGILFCATNAWGQYPMTLGDGVAANGITYSFVMNPMGSPTMYAVIKTVSSNAGAITIPAVTPETTGISMPTQQITSINSGAFSSCANLTIVTFEAANAPALSGGYAATFPNSVTTIYVPIESAKASYISAGYPEAKLAVDGASGPATSGECGDNLTWEFEDGTLTISGEGAMEDYEVASYGQPTSAPWAYYITNNLLTEVEIAGTVTTIGNYAFYNCAGLTEIDIPNSVSSIGNSAFYQCGFQSVTIPSAVTTIEDYAFYIQNLNEVTMKGSTPPSLGENVFPISSSKLTVNIPKGSLSAYEEEWGTENYDFQEIEDKCGDNLTWEYDLGTKTLTISKIDPSGTAVMYNYAKVADSERAVPGLTVEKSTAPWYDCLYYVDQKYDGIEHVVLPSDLSNIGNYAFYKFTELEAIDIPSTVTTIGEGAFRGCRVLTGITLPASLNSLGASAFMSTALTEISITNGVTTINNETFSSCSALNKIILPASLTSIGESAFNSCVALSEIEFPNTLQTIGNHAFYDCFELRTITLPENVTSIGYEAFVTLGDNAEKKGTLSTLIMKGNTPPNLVETTNTVLFAFSLYAFNGTIDVYVPAGSKEDYIEAWGTEKGDAMTQLQSRNYTFNYHEYGFSGETGEKTGSFQDETNQETNAIIQELVAAGEVVKTVTIARPIQANGNLNTICLPFALSAAQIANSDLAGATIYAFTAEDGVSEEKLLTLSPVTSMQTGVPYFFAYTNNAANTPNLTKLVFNDVLLTTAVEEPVDLDAGTFVLHGTLRPTRLNHASNYLFLGAENSLFYPQLEGTTEAEQTINPFRAYFEAKNSANQAPARFVFGRPVPTDVDNVPSDKVQCTKVLKNGQIFILRGENYYSLDGKKL